MDKKKIIILYSTAGMGHKKAAIAIYNAFKSRGEDLDIENVDVLDYANKIYKYLYLDLYVFMMSKAKWLWGALYYLSNIPFVDVLTRKIRAIMDYYSLAGVGEMLRRKNPDVIVATHFFLPSVMGILKKTKGFKAKTFVLITDNGPHSFWLSPYIDRFFVGSEFAAGEVAKRGIPKEKIDVTGISTMAEFHQKFDVPELKRKYHLDETKKTIFLMSGGFGVGPMEQMLLSLNSCRAEVQVIVVCGHNKTAYKNVAELKEKLKFPIIQFAFTDEVAKLMAVSDLMITKAGGISVTEALNARLPMILFGSIPGQETWNEEFLKEAGAAKKVESVKEIPLVVDEILSSEEVYNALKSSIDKVRRPYAAEEIAKIVGADPSVRPLPDVT